MLHTSYIKYFTGLLLLVTGLLYSCEEEKKKKTKEYTGPLMEVADLHLTYTDSARLKMILKAPLQLKLQSEDEEFPEGMDVLFYDENGEEEGSLTANYSIYYKEEEKWHLIGNVVLINLQQEKTLKSEELFWKPDEERIWTDKFVQIITPEEIITGKGLVAKDDFSEYEIQEPHGTFDAPKKEKENHN